jgi:ADP-ribose pyrophosphatase
MKAVKIERREVWRGPAWSVQEVTLAYADGALVTKGLVDHPGSVVLLPLVGDELLMLRQYRLALDQVILELPAGTRRPGESPADCAQRELREETGFRAGALTSLGQLWPAPGITNERMELFVAEALAPDPLPGDRDEEITLQRLSFAEATRLALGGDMRDAKSVAAILRLAAERGRLTPS